MDDWSEWQLWFHYFLLVCVLFVAHYFSSFIETMVVEGKMYGYPLLFVYYFVWFSLGDQLIHFTLEKITGWKG